MLTVVVTLLYRSSVPLYLVAEEARLNPHALEAILSALLDRDSDGVVTAEEAREAMAD